MSVAIAFLDVTCVFVTYLVCFANIYDQVRARVVTRNVRISLERLSENQKNKNITEREKKEDDLFL